MHDDLLGKKPSQFIRGNHLTKIQLLCAPLVWVLHLCLLEVVMRLSFSFSPPQFVALPVSALFPTVLNLHLEDVQSIM